MTEAQVRRSATKERILEAALEILTEKGDASLTMRGIADAAGMSLGNLQYHFKTRQDLLSEVVSVHFDQCSAQIKDQVAGLSVQDRRERAKFLILLALQHGQGISDMCRVFRELWAISSRDAEIERQMMNYYARFSQRIADTILGENYDAQDHAKIRSLLLPYFEGYSITAPSLPMPMDELAEMLSDIVISVIE